MDIMLRQVRKTQRHADNSLISDPQTCLGVYEVHPVACEEAIQ